MSTPGYTRISKKMCFSGYIKIHAGYSEIQFKSSPPNLTFRSKPPLTRARALVSIRYDCMVDGGRGASNTCLY